MRSSPVIGVTTQNLRVLSGIPGHLPPSSVMSHRYSAAVAAAGGAPLLVPLLEGMDDAVLRAIYGRIDGLLVPGGADPDPGSYGEGRHPLCKATDPPRDRVETTLIGWALADRKPLFGICRGMQMLAVARGGTLYQDLSAQRPGTKKHDYFPRQGYARNRISHTVETERGSALADLLGPGTVEVNSMHHQGVRDPGSGVRVVARAPDGLPEGLEVPGHPFALAVQWHPEALTEVRPAMAGLFRAFVDAAAGRNRLRPLGSASAAD